MVITRYAGEVKGQELHQASLYKSGDSRLDSVKYIVGDWLDSYTPDITLDDIRELVAYMAPISTICPHAKAGTILRPDKTGNALAQYYKMLCDEQLAWEVEVFNTYEDCFAWFGVPDQEIPLEKFREEEAHYIRLTSMDSMPSGYSNYSP